MNIFNIHSTAPAKLVHNYLQDRQRCVYIDNTYSSIYYLWLDIYNSLHYLAKKQKKHPIICIIICAYVIQSLVIVVDIIRLDFVETLSIILSLCLVTKLNLKCRDLFKLHHILLAGIYIIPKSDVKNRLRKITEMQFKSYKL